MIRKVQNADWHLMEYARFPPAFGPLVWSWGVNTLSRQLESFNEEKGGLFSMYFGSGSGVQRYW